MSKIGRKLIDTTGVQIDIQGQAVHYKGAKAQGIHVLPDVLQIVKGDNNLTLSVKRNGANAVWGLHRALLANKIKGASTGFEQKIVIVGLGFKGAVAGNKINFSLGYSHPIQFPLPDGVAVEIDKTGQNILVKCADRELLGHVSSMIRALRPPEPYKGTGIRLAEEKILRKAGKTKSA